jgi:demethylmenaquinone methyltransferase/2-methoxy-6-polyprenyl-1,4-benzoquinol methylase
MNETVILWLSRGRCIAKRRAWSARSFPASRRKYDLMNDAMSLGAHRLWKDQFVRRVNPARARTILDMAGGTGDIAFRASKRRGANVTVSDINPDMLAVGMERAVERGIDTLVSGASRMPRAELPGPHFDAYTIAFGIRNVTDIDKALREAHRVLNMAGVSSASNSQPSNGRAFQGL